MDITLKQLQIFRAVVIAGSTSPPGFVPRTSIPLASPEMFETVFAIGTSRMRLRVRDVPNEAVAGQL